MFPNLFFSKEYNKTLKSDLPPLPENLSEAWKFSKLYYQYEKIVNNTKTTDKRNDIDNILTKAKEILNREELNEEQFKKIYDSIIDIESETSLLGKIYGLFSFINLIWFFAVLGILVTVVPCMALLCGKFFVDLFLSVIIPLHKMGFIQLLGYVVCAQFVAEGFRFNIESGFNYGLVGILGSGMLQIYGYSRYSNISHDVQEIIRISILIQIGIFIPYSIHYESGLLSWGATIILFNLLGFLVLPFSWGFVIGFSNEDEALLRCVGTSLVMGLTFIGLTIGKITHKVLYIYQQPLTVFSTVVLFIGLLIYSSKWYYHYRYDNSIFNYVKRQIFFLVPLSIYVSFGLVLGLEGMTNSAITLAFFYATEKFLEFSDLFELNWSFPVLCVSLVLYGVSLFLHSHKNFIASMFSYIDVKNVTSL
jgi:hypothetical protein